MVDRYFHPSFTGTHTPAQQSEWVARRLCAQCPVRPECLRYAISLESAPYVQPVWDEKSGQVRTENVIDDELSGMWGGVTAAEREQTLGLPTAKRLRALNTIFAEKAAEVLLPGERAVA